MKSVRRHNYLILAILTPLVVQAIPPDTAWIRTYGGSNNDIGYSICACLAGGYLVAGYTSSLGSGPQSAYVVRINNAGDTVWTRAYGGTSWDGAHYVLTTPDTCFLVAGYTESFGAGGKDMYFLKLNQFGDTIWTRTYGGVLQDCAYALCIANDTGYLAVGYRNGPAAWTKGDLWLLKMDESGDTVWSKTYGGSGEDYGISLRHTLDGNYIISGVNSYQSAGGKDVWLLKVNTSGDTIWTKTYGGSLEDIGYGVNTTSDSGYIITGYINGIPPWTAGDLWLIKTNAFGDSVWTRMYGGTGEDFGFEVYETPDCGFVIAGETSFGAGQVDVWLMRTDELGDTAWTQTYGGSARDASLGFCIDNDGSYAIVGHTRSSGAGNADVYVIKTLPDMRIKVKTGRDIGHPPCCATVISGPLPLPAGSACKVYNIAGQEIQQMNPAPGVYFITINSVALQKIIKVR